MLYLECVLIVMKRLVLASEYMYVSTEYDPAQCRLQYGCSCDVRSQSMSNRPPKPRGTCKIPAVNGRLAGPVYGLTRQIGLGGPSQFQRRPLHIVGEEPSAGPTPHRNPSSAARRLLLRRAIHSP